MPERVLTLRELNRATLQRQVLLERKCLAPKALIDASSGCRPSGPAPYVGIWTRTTSFRPETLEREPERRRRQGDRDAADTAPRHAPDGARRAAMSRTNFPWETPKAKLLAPSVRARRTEDRSRQPKGSRTSSASTASPASRRAPGAPRGSGRASHAHHRDGALARAARGAVRRAEEPEEHDPTERACRAVPRYLAFGPASRRPGSRGR